MLADVLSNLDIRVLDQRRLLIEGALHAQLLPVPTRARKHLPADLPNDVPPRIVLRRARLCHAVGPQLLEGIHARMIARKMWITQIQNLAIMRVSGAGFDIMKTLVL